MNKHSNIRLLPPDAPQGNWNDDVDHPLQTWEWGSLRASHGLRVVRIQEQRDALLSNFQMTIHPIPHTPYSIGYLPKSSVPSDDMFTFLRTAADEYNCVFIKLEPANTKSDLTKEQITSLKRNTIPSPHPLFPEWTQVLDLGPNEDELLTNMKSKTRYNIRLGQKNGIRVKEMTTSEGFEIFQKLYFETCQRQKYRGHTYSYHKQLFEQLKGSLAHILIAFDGTTPLAAYELFLFKNRLYYPYGGSSDINRNKMAANIIMWEAIRFGKSHGATSFDMWGSLPPDYDQNNPWAGFTRFKEGYGATFVQLAGSFDCVYKPTLYSLYGSIQKTRSFFLHR